MMFNQYPYLNVNDLNLDYILSQIKTMMNEVTNFVSINAIKYADPIQWDITRQYEKNTVVIDPVTGTAYISVAPVPAGVALTRPEYWTVVFDLGSFVTRAAQNFTSRYEQDTTLTATFPTNTGEWLVWGDVLYKAKTNIIAGDTYVVDSNIEHFTMEDLYNAYLNTIANILALVGDLADLTTSDTSSIVNAINSVVSDFNAKIGDLDDLTTTDKTSVVNSINEVNAAVAQEVTDRTNADTALYNEIEKKPRANELSLEYVNSIVSLDSRYPAFSGNRYNSVMQGMCVNDDGNLVVVRIDESARDDYGVLEVYNTDGIKLQTSPSLQVGHGNTITYANGYYYIGWSTSASGGVVTPSNNISKIKKDFSTTQIIIAPFQIPALSYDSDNNVFYAFRAGVLYTFDDTFSAPLTNITCDEKFYNTSIYTELTRQNGVYYNGYWMQVYIWPAHMVWYDVTTGELVKVYNFPRRLLYNGFSVYEPENVVYVPALDLFYSSCYARCGAGDVATNTLVRYNPFTNAVNGDDRYYQRHGIVINLYVDPSISDNAFMNGKTTHPFKYIQNALDLVAAFPDTAFVINVRTSNNYLGCIQIANCNNFTIILDTGYVIDVSETIPTIEILRSNTVAIFNMNCGAVTCAYDSNIQFGSLLVTGTISINRVYDVAIQGSTCDTLTLRNCGCSLYDNTYNTLNRVGEVVFKQENIKYFDGGFENVTSVPANSYYDVPINYNRPSNGTPAVVAMLHINSTNMAILANMNVVSQNRSATGCTLRVINNDSSAHSVGLNWLAFIPS